MVGVWLSAVDGRFCEATVVVGFARTGDGHNHRFFFFPDRAHLRTSWRIQSGASQPTIGARGYKQFDIHPLGLRMVVASGRQINR